MKLLSFEDDNSVSDIKKYGAVSISIYADDILLFEHRKIDRIDLRDSKFDFLIKHLSVGDSCHFIVPTEQVVTIFHPLKLKNVKTKELSVYIKLDNVFDEELDQEMVEQHILKSYLKKFKTKAYQNLYMKTIEVGTGKEVEVGDEITIAYKGYFLNGLVFDSISGKTSFTFTYGSQGQVIKGLEIAIKLMREGQKSKIIIPSQLAFGELGSTTLIVPAYTTVVYDLEVIKVN